MKERSTLKLVVNKDRNGHPQLRSKTDVIEERSVGLRRRRAGHKQLPRGSGSSINSALDISRTRGLMMTTGSRHHFRGAAVGEVRVRIRALGGVIGGLHGAGEGKKNF